MFVPASVPEPLADSTNSLPPAIRVCLNDLHLSGSDIQRHLLNGDVISAIVLLGERGEVPHDLLTALGDWYSERDLIGPAAAAYIVGDIRPRIARLTRELLRDGRYDEAAAICARIGATLPNADVEMYVRLSTEREDHVDARAAEQIKRRASWPA